MVRGIRATTCVLMLGAIVLLVQACAVEPAGSAQKPAEKPVAAPPPSPLSRLERLPAVSAADAQSRVVPVLADTAVDPAEERAAPGEEFERGGASWYGSRFHGRRTASGEKFDTADFTAAHRTLPFGTLVCVRNIANNRVVAVRVNDRGPGSKKRVIDISQAAADVLAMVGMGVQTVALQRPVSGQQRCE